MAMELRLWLTSSRNGRELVKMEGAEAIQELQRMADLAQEVQVRAMQSLAQAA